MAKLWQASVVLEQCSNCCGLGSTCNISQQALSVGQLDVQSGGGMEQDGGGVRPTDRLPVPVQDRGRRSAPTHAVS